MEFFFGYISFLVLFFSLFYLFLFAVKTLFKYICLKLKLFLNPPPHLSEEIRDQILTKAADFVHSKHRPWQLDDMFAEYLEVSAWMLNKKWEEMYVK